MAFEVLIAEHAERDIADIHASVAEADSRARADRLVDALEELCAKLAELPERGNMPRELSDLGMREVREVHHGPYRVIYRVVEGRMIVYSVLDGRRDVQSLLERRLLR